MATINVRGLDDDVIRRLKQQAAGHNRSLESEARRILERADEDDMPAKRVFFRALAARLRRETEGRAQTPSETLKYPTGGGDGSNGSSFPSYGGLANVPMDWHQS